MNTYILSIIMYVSEKGVVPFPTHLGVIAIENEAFVLPSTNSMGIIMYIYNRF